MVLSSLDISNLVPLTSISVSFMKFSHTMVMQKSCALTLTYYTRLGFGIGVRTQQGRTNCNFTSGSRDQELLHYRPHGRFWKRVQEIPYLSCPILKKKKCKTEYIHHQTNPSLSFVNIRLSSVLSILLHNIHHNHFFLVLLYFLCSLTNWKN